MTAQFEDIKIEYSTDPLPTEKPKRSKPSNSGANFGGPKRPVGRPPTTSVRKEVQQEIDAFIALMAVPVVMRDPTCGGVLMQQRVEISNALADIAMKNPALLKLLRSGGDVMLYVKLAMAVSPVLVTVYQHHFVHEFEEPNVGENLVA